MVNLNPSLDGVWSDLGERCSSISSLFLACAAGGGSVRREPASPRSWERRRRRMTPGGVEFLTLPRVRLFGRTWAEALDVSHAVDAGCEEFGGAVRRARRGPGAERRRVRRRQRRR
ncbi:hypothetical protein VM1G_11322 [Cytospora mali]|uniref:Uncharacterized protein n=1 Tax=Cytospora mali TaxID=578113 RepID=A0A194VLP5_CYTMA|nr:hypothetical protein VM1G_11322 [Valsa mali]